VSAEGDHASFCVSLASPDSARPEDWIFRREVWKQGEQAIVDRETSATPHKGDPKSGLAALRLAETPIDSEAAIFLKALASYSLYSPDTPILRGWARDPQIREPIGLSGGRLVEAAAELLKDKESRSQLSDEFRSGIEWFGNFGISESALREGRHTILFKDRFFRTDNSHNYSLRPNDVSEGVLYMLFLAVLCLHPDSPRLFAVDNADHGLNPLLAKHLIKTMCDWITNRQPARQIFLTTHNPLVLDGLPLGDDRIRLFTVDRDNKGKSQIQRFVITDQHRQMASKGWTLSRMWVNGLIGGVPNV
jgi:predicted ATPase